MAIQQQVHEKFKVFVGANIAELDSQVRAFTAGGNVAVKSIGVGGDGGHGTLILTVGYKEGEAGYAVQLLTKDAGTVDPSSSDSLKALEMALDAAAASSNKAICHELMVQNGKVTAVLLTLV